MHSGKTYEKNKTVFVVFFFFLVSPYVALTKSPHNQIKEERISLAQNVRLQSIIVELARQQQPSYIHIHPCNRSSKSQCIHSQELAAMNCRRTLVLISLSPLRGRAEHFHREWCHLQWTGLLISVDIIPIISHGGAHRPT